jgi:hypothetical protein
MTNKNFILKIIALYAIGFICLLIYFSTNNTTIIAISSWNILRFALLIAGIAIPVIVTFLVIKKYVGGGKL